jgi:hypothetical protein
MTDGCACGRAWQTGEQIMVEDVCLDEAFAPFRQIAAEAGFRSVHEHPTRCKRRYASRNGVHAICKSVHSNQDRNDYMQGILCDGGGICPYPRQG